MAVSLSEHSVFWDSEELCRPYSCPALRFWESTGADAGQLRAGLVMIFRSYDDCFTRCKMTLIVWTPRISAVSAERTMRNGNEINFDHNKRIDLPSSRIKVEWAAVHPVRHGIPLPNGLMKLLRKVSWKTARPSQTVIRSPQSRTRREVPTRPTF